MRAAHARGETEHATFEHFVALDLPTAAHRAPTRSCLHDASSSHRCFDAPGEGGGTLAEVAAKGGAATIRSSPATVTHPVTPDSAVVPRSRRFQACGGRPNIVIMR